MFWHLKSLLAGRYPPPTKGPPGVAHNLCQAPSQASLHHLPCPQRGHSPTWITPARCPAAQNTPVAQSPEKSLERPSLVFTPPCLPFPANPRQGRGLRPPLSCPLPPDPDPHMPGTPLPPGLEACPESPQVATPEWAANKKTQNGLGGGKEGKGEGGLALGCRAPGWAAGGKREHGQPWGFVRWGGSAVLTLCTPWML